MPLILCQSYAPGRKSTKLLFDYATVGRLNRCSGVPSTRIKDSPSRQDTLRRDGEDFVVPEDVVRLSQPRLMHSEELAATHRLAFSPP